VTLGAVALALVLLAVGTETGTRMVLRRGLAWYDARIPGRLAVGAIDGALLDRLILRDVRGFDRRGDGRVRVDLLRLDWTPAALLDGELVAVLRVEGAEVRTGPGGDPAPLGDLAPPPGPEPPPPSEQAPPELPLAIAAWVHVRGATALADGEPALAEGADLSLAVRGSGRRIEVALHRARVRVPTVPVEVRRLDLKTAWDGEALSLAYLALETDQGDLALSAVHVLPAARRGRLDLTARVAAEAIRRHVGDSLPAPIIDDPRLEATADGGLEGADLTATLTVGDATRVGVSLHAALEPRPRVDLRVRLEGVDPALVGLEPETRFVGDVRVQAEAPPTPLDHLSELDPTAVRATIDVDCPRCVLPAVGRLSARVHAELKAGRGEATVRAQALGADVEGDARLDRVDAWRTSGLAARWRIEVPDVGPPTRLAGLEAVHGRLSTSGRCEGNAEAVVCKGDLGLADAAGFGAQLRAVHAAFEAEPLAKPPRFSAVVDLDGARAPGVPNLLAGRIAARGDLTAVEVDADISHGGDRVALAAGVRPGPPLRVDVRRLSAAGFGQTLALLQPATVRLEGAAVHVAGLRLSTLGGTVTADGVFDSTGRSDLHLRLEEIDLAAASPYAGDMAPAGRLGLDARLKGALAAPELQATVRGRDLGLRGQRVGDLDLKASLRGGRAKADLRVADAARAIAVSADVPLVADLGSGRIEPRPNGVHHVRIVLTAVDDAWARRFAQLPDGVAFRVDSELEGHGALGDWRVHGSLGGAARGPQVDDTPFSVALDLGPRTQKATVSAKLEPKAVETGPLDIVADLEAGADVEALAQGAPPDPATPLRAVVRVPSSPLAPLSPLLPPALHDLGGRAEVQVRVRGTVAAPEVAGSVLVQDAAVTVVPLGQRITGLTTTLQLTDRTLVLEEVAFSAGKGRGRAAGSAALAVDGTLSGDLRIAIDALPLVAPGAPPALLDSRVRVQAQRPAGGAAEVTATVTGTRLRIIDLKTDGPRPIPSHPRVRVLGAPRAPPPTASAEAPAPLLLRVRLPEPLLVVGPGLDMKWAGGLTIRQGNAMAIEGALRARSGYLELLGNRFEIAEGEVTLADADGAVVPFVRIVARAQTEEALVTARIRGKATRPELTFESDPPLPTDLILTLLVTGRTTSNDEQDQTVAEQAASLFASFQSPAVERAIQDRLGLDRVRLTFGEGGVESPILSFGKHLTRWLYVEARYRHSPREDENETELNTELQLGPRWTLETGYGDQGVGSADVFWRVPLHD